MEHPDDRLKKFLTSNMAKTPEEPAHLKDRIWSTIQNEAHPRPAHRWRIAGALASAAAAMIALVWFQNTPSHDPYAELDAPSEEVQILEGLSPLTGEDSEEMEFIAFYESM